MEHAVTFHESEDPCEAHYSDNKGDFRAGEVYRIWHPTNTQVHLGTFMVLCGTGNDMAWLRIVQPEKVDDKFEMRHGKLREEQDRFLTHRRLRTSLRSKPPVEEESEPNLFFLSPAKGQRMKENCWIDLECPWNIKRNEDYLFVFCGHFHKESYQRARDVHLELYRDRLYVFGGSG